jgi:hypothetical protein
LDRRSLTAVAPVPRGVTGKGRRDGGAPLSLPAALPPATGWKEAEGAATDCHRGAIGSGWLSIAVKVRAER